MVVRFEKPAGAVVAVEFFGPLPLRGIGLTVLLPHDGLPWQRGLSPKTQRCHQRSHGKHTPER